MQSTGVVIVGAGGHGAVITDALLASGAEVAGFADDRAATLPKSIRGVPVLGTVDECLSSRLRQGGDCRIALAIGDNRRRMEVAEQWMKRGCTLVTIVHPRAFVSPFATLDPGVAILPGAVINAGAKIEVGAIVNSGAIVEHDSVVGRFAHLSPQAVMGGGAWLGVLVHAGLAAVILPGIGVGSGAVVGAGAVVTRSLPPNVVAVGIPARVVRETKAVSFGHHDLSQ